MVQEIIVTSDNEEDKTHKVETINITPMAVQQLKIKKVKKHIQDEENAKQVQERIEKGCECQDENCFQGLSAEFVYRHRLNIAELTKSEHDMYLMGVTMAVVTNPEETIRHKERRRLRAQYAFQGRRVCLDAFLYLENCSHYQLKRIRKHVMTHGVTPRVHGNHGKRPHNTLPLDNYRHATEFLKHYIEKNALPDYQSKKASNVPKLKQRLVMPGDITRKTIHNAYKEFCEYFEPNIKIMGYSTFRHFMKEQFPKLRFPRNEQKFFKPDSANANISKFMIPVSKLDHEDSEEIDIEGDSESPLGHHAIIIGLNGEIIETNEPPIAYETID